jgi:sulfopyruvate decarboxylase subunit alpha
VYHRPVSPPTIDPGHAPAFLAALERAGFDFFAGVPCSLLTGVMRLLDAEPRYGYLSAVREDAAIGAAAGAYLGGGRPVVFMQNSGLGVSINALASLSLLYELPVLLVISWRGEGGRDAPEHLLMGQVTDRLLDTLGIDHALLDPARIEAQVAEAAARLDQTRRPVALIVRKGILE